MAIASSTRIHGDIAKCIGDTPLVRLRHLNRGTTATVVGKVESLNPAWSVKDRIGCAMIDAIERDGHIHRDQIIIDSRTPAEYAGQDLRGNKRGGHIPGAKLLNNEDLVDKATGTTISREAAKAKVEALIPKGKTVVVYCQSGTRCSHEELILKDLGYENVVLYDASFQEWSNLDNTPVEKSVESPSAPPKSDKVQQPGKAAKLGSP